MLCYVWRRGRTPSVARCGSMPAWATHDLVTPGKRPGSSGDGRHPTTTIHPATMISNDFTYNNIQALVTAHKKMVRRFIRSELWPGEPAVTAH
jgi:hypothetical protein